MNIRSSHSPTTRTAGLGRFARNLMSLFVPRWAVAVLILLLQWPQTAEAQFSRAGFTTTGFIRDNTVPVFCTPNTSGGQDCLPLDAGLPEALPACVIGPASPSCDIVARQNLFVNDLSSSVSGGAFGNDLRSRLTYNLMKQTAGSFVGEYQQGVSFRSPPIVASVNVERARKFVVPDGARRAEFSYEVSGKTTTNLVRQGEDLCDVFENGAPVCEFDKPLPDIFLSTGAGRLSLFSSSLIWDTFTSNQLTFNAESFGPLGDSRSFTGAATLLDPSVNTLIFKETFSLTGYLQDCLFDGRENLTTVRPCLRAFREPYKLFVDADFESTVTLTQVRLFDAGGNFLPESRLRDEDGTVISNGVTVNVVPEPSSGWLLAVGMSVLLAVRTRRHRQGGSWLERPRSVTAG